MYQKVSVEKSKKAVNMRVIRFLIRVRVPSSAFKPDRYRAFFCYEISIVGRKVRIYENSGL